MKRRTIGLIVAASAAALLLHSMPAAADPPPYARAWGYPHRDDYDAREYRDQDWDDRHDHDWADRHDWHRGPVYYPRPAYYVQELPWGYRAYTYGGMPYYYCAGRWYRPYGPRYGVVAPPAGLVIDRRGIRGYVTAEVPIARW
jgi:hypothetical protein